MAGGDIRIIARGPLFDGRAPGIMRRFTEDARHTVAVKGESMMFLALGQTLRHPTGYYESHITITSEGNAEIVNDQGIIYGPWLEGVGSRNRTTRFKGYFNWRRTKQALVTMSPEIVTRLLHEKYLPELRGGA